MTQIFNIKDKTKLRQKLRKELSICELKVWYYIRNRQINGVKFRRQYGIQNYVVDFYSPEIKLAIEIDGDSHYKDQEQRIKDRERDNYIRSLGLDIIRFTNIDVMQNIEGVTGKIKEFVDFLLETSALPPLTPPSKGGE